MSLSAVLDSFVAKHPECYDGRRVSGECDTLSRALQGLLRGSRLVRAEGYKLKPERPIWHIPVNYWCHTALELDGKVIDVTARQFDSNYPVPRIVDLETIEKEWTEIRIVG